MKFEEFDIRQRLTLAKGYTVAEIGISSDSELANKTIKDTGLKDKDVLILSITRQGLVIPNPKGSQEILSGDILLCYGKQLTLRVLHPEVEPPRNKRGSKKLT